ncbi:unnamed protein product [Rotaria magnacalcarata]
MPSEMQLTESERKLILALHKKNKSHREIAKKINRSKTVVTNFLKDPRMNAKGYQEVLKKHLIDIGSCMGGSDWIFQQDNAPIHRAKVNLAWFKSKKINVLPWPSLSPDLNPIENLWGILARKVYAGGKQFRTKEQLKTTIIKSWEEITIEQLRALVESMPERIFEVIKLNGAKTKY